MTPIAGTPQRHQLNAVASALTHAPENAAYGLMAFAPLGAAFGTSAMFLALLAAVASNLVASSLGGGRLASGPRAALALLTAGLVQALIPLWSTGEAGDAGRILLLVALGVAIAGGLQIVIGLLRMGSLVKYMPYPVRVGLTGGIGLLLAMSAWPLLSGQDLRVLSAGLEVWAAPQAPALAIGLASAGAAAFAIWRRWRMPPLLLGLLVGMALHLALQVALPLWPAGPLAGSPIPTPGILDVSIDAWRSGWFQPDEHTDAWLPTLKLLAVYALTVAALGTLDTLLATSLVDGRLRQWRDPDRELVAQGCAQIVGAFAGGQPGSPSVPRSFGLLSATSPPRHVVLTYALAMAAAAAAAPWAMAWVPLSALGGVLLVQGLAMFAPTLMQLPWNPLRARWRESAASGSGSTEASHGLLWSQWGVSITVVVAALVYGVGPALLVGASFAVLLFVRANLRDVVRATWRGHERVSPKLRPAVSAQALRDAGHRLAILELQGPLFFGTADALRARLSGLATDTDAVVLDLRQVQEVDVTGARILFECTQDWLAAGKQVLLAEWAPGDPRRAALEAVAGVAGTASLHFETHADRALEHAEDALLLRLGVQAPDRQRLGLHETALARGLDDAELALLQTHCRPVRFAQGDRLFTRGEAGDAIYVSLMGEVALHVPGSGRRLTALAAGVSFGEIAVLARGARTVDAVAETDVEALALPASTLARWLHEQPALAAKIMHNLALQLAERLGLLTDDLARWVDRAGHGAAPARPGAAGAAGGSAADTAPWSGG